MNQNLTGFTAVGWANNSLLFHLVKKPGRPSVAHLEPPLKEGSRGPIVLANSLNCRDKKLVFGTKRTILTQSNPSRNHFLLVGGFDLRIFKKLDELKQI